ILLSYIPLLSLFSSLTLQYLHSFPTRRSSDLGRCIVLVAILSPSEYLCVSRILRHNLLYSRFALCVVHLIIRHSFVSVTHFDTRSEEHTSELQSRFELVFRLLLEKKKNYTNEL